MYSRSSLACLPWNFLYRSISFTILLSSPFLIKHTFMMHPVTGITRQLIAFIRFLSLRYSLTRCSVRFFISLFTLFSTFLTSISSLCSHPRKLYVIILFWVQCFHLFLQYRQFLSFDHLSFPKYFFRSFLYAIACSCVHTHLHNCFICDLWLWRFSWYTFRSSINRLCVLFMHLLLSWPNLYPSVSSSSIAMGTSTESHWRIAITLQKAF